MGAPELAKCLAGDLVAGVAVPVEERLVARIVAGRPK